MSPRVGIGSYFRHSHKNTGAFAGEIDYAVVSRPGIEVASKEVQIRAEKNR